MAKATTGKTRSTKKKSTTSGTARAKGETSFSDLGPELGAKVGVVEGEGREFSSPIDEETHAKYEEIKRGEIHITELQKMSVQELHEVAKTEGLEE